MFSVLIAAAIGVSVRVGGFVSIAPPPRRHSRARDRSVRVSTSMQHVCLVHSWRELESRFIVKLFSTSCSSHWRLRGVCSTGASAYSSFCTLVTLGALCFSSFLPDISRVCTQCVALLLYASQSRRAVPKGSLSLSLSHIHTRTYKDHSLATWPQHSARRSCTVRIYSTSPLSWCLNQQVSEQQVSEQHVSVRQRYFYSTRIKRMASFFEL